MSETPQDTNPVLHDWLSSTVIFRTFRMAVQPGKILLALGGLLLTCLVGVCMDAIWSASGAEVYSGEIMQYVTRPHFSRWKERRREADTEMLAGILVAHKAADDVAAARKLLQDDRAGAMSRLRTKLQSEFEPLMSLDTRLSAEEERIGAIVPPFASPCLPSWNMASRATCGL